MKNKTIGVFPGKLMPFHRGHLAAILKASTMCDKLYVVVCGNDEETEELSVSKLIPLKLRATWVSKELSNMSHISVIVLDETKYNIPRFPNGWEQWAEALKRTVPEKFDIIFGNEESYRESHEKYLSGVEYRTFDVGREEFKISGTEIRNNPIKHWDMLSGASRPFFAKKILITGTESCGKTTLTKALAKFFYTSWSEEVGRYYSERYLGGREDAFELSDFERIAWLQQEQDLEALRTSNKVVFFDTDALITNFYAIQYLGESSNFLLEFAKRQEYDLIIAMTPNIPWVADGQRWLSDQEIRETNHKIILDMYKKHKPNIPIIEVTGADYLSRYEKVIEIVKKVLEG